MTSLRVRGQSVGVTFVSNREMASLRQQYMKKKGPTDVLSFPCDSDDLLGDIVISVDIARIQSVKRGSCLRDEYLYLIIHGLLHLVGYDHHSKKDYETMKKMEEKLAKAISLKMTTMLKGME